ncbi:MAG: hypothetical protein ACYSU8_02280 [Planctomycetota bacterium]|jgi:hypothetical protein
MKTYLLLFLTMGIILLTSCRKRPSDAPAESQPDAVVSAAEAEPATPPQTQPETEPILTAQVGLPAPDFDLPRLTFETQPDGSMLGKLSNETVKLSSFKGKKPVFLIFSSYT